MLEIRGISKSYGSVPAVYGVELTIREGEFFSLLGPSGCGKTTLLRLLAGFERPDQGEILLDGKRIDPLDPNLRPFNLVFQKYALFPHLSVSENIAFGLKIRKTPPREVARRIEEVLSLVKMETFGPRRVTTLSGGQMQRIALARALVNRPRVLLLDEPLSALDLKLRQQMQVELLTIQRQLKISFIFVTHDQDEALTLSDRIAVMNDGRVEQMGGAAELYENPQTPFVAHFIGSINSLELEVERAEDRRWQLRSRDGTRLRAWTSESRVNPVLRSGATANLLIRPEKISLLKSPSAQDTLDGIRGRLIQVLYQGPITRYLVESDLCPGRPLSVARTNTAEGSRQKFQAGDEVWLAWSPEDAILMQNGGMPG